jgi:spore germination protein YaaH
MKRSQAIALTALTTALAAGFTYYLLNRRKHAKRKDFVANAGYEMAYDIHYPLRYSKPGRANSRNGSDQPSEQPSSL